MKRARFFGRRRIVRGFTLVEILVALGLSAVMASLLLMLTRSQLLAYEMNDQVSRMQQNARAGMDFLESNFRRACAGISEGEVTVNLPTLRAQSRPCITVWDGAAQATGTFTTGTGTAPDSTADAIEIIYGGTPYTQAILPSMITPSISVADTTGFTAGSMILLTNGKRGIIAQIASITAGAPGTLNLTSIAGGFATPLNYVPAAGDLVLQAQSVSFYVETTAGVLQNTLMYDPDGSVGNSHADAQPLIEGVTDLQIALGTDTNADGILTEALPDEWLGNQSGELTAAVTTPDTVTQSQLRSIRTTLLVQSTNVYPGAIPTMGPYENRSVYPTAGASNPRYRVMRLSVAPRIWNLRN